MRWGVKARRVKCEGDCALRPPSLIKRQELFQGIEHHVFDSAPLPFTCSHDGSDTRVHCV